MDTGSISFYLYSFEFVVFTFPIPSHLVLSFLRPNIHRSSLNFIRSVPGLSVSRCFIKGQSLTPQQATVAPTVCHPQWVSSLLLSAVRCVVFVSSFWDVVHLKKWAQGSKETQKTTNMAAAPSQTLDRHLCPAVLMWVHNNRTCFQLKTVPSERGVTGNTHLWRVCHLSRISYQTVSGADSCSLPPSSSFSFLTICTIVNRQQDGMKVTLVSGRQMSHWTPCPWRGHGLWLNILSERITVYLQWEELEGIRPADHVSSHSF